MKDFSYITNSHPEFIENLYRDYVSDPGSVDPEMKKFFEGFDFAMENSKAFSNGKPATVATSQPIAVESTPSKGVDWGKELGAYRMILGYRNKGHLIAKTNPIRERKDRNANLSLSFFGLNEEDLDKTFEVGERLGLGATTLRNMLDKLQEH